MNENFKHFCERYKRKISLTSNCATARER